MADILDGWSQRRALAIERGYSPLEFDYYVSFAIEPTQLAEALRQLPPECRQAQQARMLAIARFAAGALRLCKQAFRRVSPIS